MRPFEIRLWSERYTRRKHLSSCVIGLALSVATLYLGERQQKQANLRAVMSPHISYRHTAQQTVSSSTHSNRRILWIKIDQSHSKEFKSSQLNLEQERFDVSCRPPRAIFRFSWLFEWSALGNKMDENNYSDRACDDGKKIQATTPTFIWSIFKFQTRWCHNPLLKLELN